MSRWIPAGISSCITVPRQEGRLFSEFDATGTFVKAFGSELQIVRAHGMRIDDGDNIWITDVNSHTVSKLDRNGKLLMTLGTKGQAGKWNPASGAQLFNQPTDVGFDGAGNVYVANSHGGHRSPR